MLTVLLNWCYILFIIFCLGFGFSCFSGRVFSYSFKRVDSVLMAGLVISTSYAMIFSLFYRVNAEANVILLVLCAVIAAVFGRRMWDFLKDARKRTSLLKKLVIFALFLLWSFFTSRGYMVPDTDMYHAQSIRWIEEYGVVKGLGNLHGRFAYNSSIFATSALFSMKFLLGRSLHTVNGLIAFVLSVQVLELGKAVKRKKMLLSDFARVGAAYYLTTIWDEVLAPSSDYAVMCTIFYIVIKWLVQLEDEEDREKIAPYGLLCVMGVYAVTLKLTAGLILLLLLKPAYMLLKQKRWKEILIYLCLGLLLAVPWMSRTVIISGWLLYPFPALDLFDVDWKMRNVENIKVDAAQIRTWARGANAYGLFGVPLTTWFPNWFKTQLTATEKLLILGDLFSCVLVILTALWVFLRKRWEKLDELLVLATVMCCYLFWQLSAPMTRYGYAHILLLTALTAGFLLRDRKPVKAVYLCLALYGIYKLWVGCDYIAGCCRLPNYVWQETYGTYELIEYEIGGIPFYASPDGGGTGYDPFPSSPSMETEMELRGKGLKDGFRPTY